MVVENLNMRRLRSFVALLVVCLAAAGCSLSKLGYEALPTLAQWEIDRYLDLDEQQREIVARRLDGLHRWHRNAQLPEYVGFLREVDDRVLIHCFAGCSVEDVLSSVGLTLSDLFCQPLGHHRPPTKQHIPASDRLAAIDHEALVVCLAATQLARGEALLNEDLERLLIAARRIGKARDHD